MLRQSDRTEPSQSSQAREANAAAQSQTHRGRQLETKGRVPTRRLYASQLAVGMLLPLIRLAAVQRLGRRPAPARFLTQAQRPDWLTSALPGARVQGKGEQGLPPIAQVQTLLDRSELQPGSKEQGPLSFRPDHAPPFVADPAQRYSLLSVCSLQILTHSYSTAYSPCHSIGSGATTRSGPSCLPLRLAAASIQGAASIRA